MKERINIGKPLRKYRVYVRELLAKNNKKERMRSFMIYDYTGRTNIKIIVERLQGRKIK
jgi:hypothetical protein